MSVLCWCSLQLASKKHPASFKNVAVSCKLLLRKNRIARNLWTNSLICCFQWLYIFSLLTKVFVNCCTLQCTSVTSLVKSFNKMHRVLSLYLWSPETQGFFLFQQHTNSRLGCWQHHYGSSMLRELRWYPGKRGPGSRAPHRHEAGRALALTGGTQRVILILRNGHFAPSSPKEAGIQRAVQYEPGAAVPAAATTPRDTYSTGLPASAPSRQLSPTAERQEEDERALGKNVGVYLPSKKPFLAATSLPPVLLSQLSRPSAGATQWNSFDFVHPRSRRASLNRRCSCLRQRLAITLRVLHGNCLQKNYIVYVFLLQLTNYLKCQVARYRNKGVYCML